MVTKVVKAELALLGRKQNELIAELANKGFVIDHAQLSLIINNKRGDTDYTKSIERAILEVIKEWKENSK